MSISKTMPNPLLPALSSKVRRMCSHDDRMSCADERVPSTMSSLVKMESQVDECIGLIETRFREFSR